jgi:hypothetical protein
VRALLNKRETSLYRRIDQVGRMMRRALCRVARFGRHNA